LILDCHFFFRTRSSHRVTQNNFWWAAVKKLSVQKFFKNSEMNLKCQKIYFNYKNLIINILIIFIEKNCWKRNVFFKLFKIILFKKIMTFQVRFPSAVKRYLMLKSTVRITVIRCDSLGWNCKKLINPSWMWGE